MCSLCEGMCALKPVNPDRLPRKTQKNIQRAMQQQQHEGGLCVRGMKGVSVVCQNVEHDFCLVVFFSFIFNSSYDLFRTVQRVVKSID